MLNMSKEDEILFQAERNAKGMQRNVHGKLQNFK
jgi:hypothetical protein